MRPTDTLATPPAEPPVLPALYWEDRLTNLPGLQGVGHVSYGAAYNEWLYRLRRRLFLRHVLALHLDLRQATVLDVGSGTGFWVDVWKSLGPKTVTASDVTQCAANQLRQRHPEIRVVRLDISSHDATQTLGTHYEIISAMDVLFHITCDEDFATAIANLSRLLRPRGFLVFSDNMLQRERPATATQANRTLETVQKHLSRNGLQIIRRAPMFFMMNAPIDVSSDAVRGLWRTMMAPLRRFPALGSLYGAALFPLDLVLTQIVSQSPSTELVICQKFTR